MSLIERFAAVAVVDLELRKYIVRCNREIQKNAAMHFLVKTIFGLGVAMSMTVNNLRNQPTRGIGLW